MTEDQTVAFMEIRESEEILSEIPDKVFVTEFVNEERYMVVSNMTDRPYVLNTRGIWEDRVSGAAGMKFEVPAKRILFLVRRESDR